MPIHNVMKDMVTNILEEVLLRDSSLVVSARHREDIIAYVLNRMPPWYITSERGLLHASIRAGKDYQTRVDIIFMIYESINEIINRRESAITVKTGPIRASSILPRIVGIVFDQSDFSVIPDVEVSLAIENSLAEMIDEGWQNPYRTVGAGMGYYHFWPSHPSGTVARFGNMPMRLMFRHPNYCEKAVDIDVPILHRTEAGKTITVPTVLIEPK